MRYLLIATLLFSSIAQSDTKLIIGGLSSHSNQVRPQGFAILPKHHQMQAGGLVMLDEVRYNETHPAIGIQRHGIEATAYYNSLSEVSYSLSKIITNKEGYGARLGVAWYDEIVPVAQFGYFAKNYDITFGYVSVLTLKVSIE